MAQRLADDGGREEAGEEEEREVGEGYHCERLMGGAVVWP